MIFYILLLKRVKPIKNRVNYLLCWDASDFYFYPDWKMTDTVYKLAWYLHYVLFTSKQYVF